MKKFFVILFLLMMLSTVVYGATFDDTEGLNCEGAVDKISYLGIVNGVGGNNYAPSKSVTRAELSKMIVNAIKSGNGTNNRSFSDIQNHWGKEYVLKAASLNILNGYTDGTFKPDKEVSYAEAVAIMMRCLGYNDLENNTSNVWYENYISKMKEIKLNNGVEDFSPEAAANRGDIAILLWNMISFDGNGSSILQKNYSNYEYWENVKINEITVYADRILYVTSKGNFYMDNDIDFSNLGGMVSGFYDKKANLLHCMTVDGGLNLKKISGNVKTIKEMGYDTFECENIMGYGTKEYAKYVDVFVDEKTDKTSRVVFYDTSESYFAEDIKIGKSEVTIESRDVYDHSIVYLENGQKLEYKFLRTESVKDIDLNALLVYNGELIDWESVPDNSVIMEIRKNSIYTYINEFVTGGLDENVKDINKLTIDGVTYVVAEECICENIELDITKKLVDGLTSSDLKIIAQKDDEIKVYLNQFDEIVKLEFSYDIWKMHELEAREEEYKELKVQLGTIGIISKLYWDFPDDDGDYEVSTYIESLPNVKSDKYTISSSIKLGDLVYVESGDDAVKQVNGNVELDGINIIANYGQAFEEDGIGEYSIDEKTEVVEVVLTVDSEGKKEYSKCTLKNIVYEELREADKYKSVNLVVNEDGVIIRMYAIREVGSTDKFGIVKNIEEIIEEEDDVLKIKTTVSIINDKKRTVKCTVLPVMGYSSGDLVKYEIDSEDKANEETVITVVESFKHEAIGNSQDLIVQKNSNGIVKFENSDKIMYIADGALEYDGKRYELEEYTVINAEVTKNLETDEWIFKSFTIKNNGTINLRAKNRIAINELSGTIVIYTGYVEK